MKLLARDNPEKIREYNRRSYLKNREKILAAQRARYPAVYAKKKEEIKARTRAWLAAHPGYSKTRSKAYYYANREHILAKLRSERRGDEWRAKWKDLYYKHRERYNRHSKEYYQRNRQTVLDNQKTRYVRQSFISGRKERSREQVDWACVQGCGRETKHPTGACKWCRTSVCKKCREPLLMEWIGQRLHKKCIPNSFGIINEVA